MGLQRLPFSMSKRKSVITEDSMTRHTDSIKGEWAFTVGCRLGRTFGQHLAPLFAFVAVCLPVASLCQGAGAWEPWKSVSEGHAGPRVTVTAVPYGQRFAVFLADPTGGDYAAPGTPDQGGGPFQSVSEGHARPRLAV